MYGIMEVWYQGPSSLFCQCTASEGPVSVLVRFTKCPPSSNMNVRRPSHGDLLQDVVLSEQATITGCHTM